MKYVWLFDAYDFKWIIIGKVQKSDYLTLCQKMRYEFGLENIVFFADEKSNPFPYYKNCDLYVQTSVTEGRAISIEEAKTFNCAIVSTGFASV